MNAPSNNDPTKRTAPGIPGTAQGIPATDDQSIDDVPMFKRKRVIIPLFVTLIAVMVGVAVWYLDRFSSVATDDAYVDSDRATISAKISGRIVFLPFDENDTVHKGDTLARLDDADLRAQLQKAEASIRYLTRSAEIAGVNLARAQEDFSRAEKQFQGQVVSQEQYDHAKNARELAEAQEDMANAQIATAQADLAIVKTQLGNTVITAPFGGIIAKRWVLASDVVSPGQAIYSMFDHVHMWITANFEETKLRMIRPGERVKVEVDAFPKALVSGKVENIGRSTASQFSLIPAGNASGNFTKITQRVPVKIALVPSPDVAALLPGLSVYVRIFSK